MGYACPVCEVPQRDETHLANHLAFTAMLHGDEHETWLDEHVDGWNDRKPSELAEVVSEFAAEAEFDEVFEDTVHDHGDGHDHDDPASQRGGALFDDAYANQQAPGVSGRSSGGAGFGGELDADAEAILLEAQELTRQMIDDAAGNLPETETDAETDTETGDRKDNNE
ncbi:DUF5810 domain-containing protein [Natronocalculus amylovorans]|uniref:DUF5810 domain-containing protein n=1 Tax=Natronocalculus amylovorans TaxID=2917812 RepID=A0AAE3KAH8_9EURY|nr:DUF5810 domain-containing protein [Natronocalculus amylovorans]MCL9816839.1 DUF5810 domain-containing protein [Natronocalculus amylovorans]NUE01280.1 hypothetical protein [Halorubraceae archaeon YAN]